MAGSDVNLISTPAYPLPFGPIISPPTVNLVFVGANSYFIFIGGI